MEENDLIYLEDETGEELAYVPLRYFHSEGVEYLLLAPQGETATAQNGVVLKVEEQGEEELLTPVEDDVAEGLLGVALAQFDME